MGGSGGVFLWDGNFFLKHNCGDEVLEMAKSINDENEILGRVVEIR